MTALLLTTDGQLWHQDLDTDTPIEPQLLTHIRRQHGLTHTTLHDGSTLYYGTHLPTLPTNPAATHITDTTITGRALLITDNPHHWINTILDTTTTTHA